MSNRNCSGLRRAAAMFLCCSGIVQARAEVTVLFSPEPARAARAIGITMAGVWAVRACNSGEAAVTVMPERVFQGAPDVPFLEAAEAQLVLQQSHYRTGRVRIARYLEGAVVLASVLTGGGMIAASPKVVVALGLSVSAAHQLGDIIQGVAPDLTTISSQLLSAPLVLPAGGCQTRIALADVQTDAKPISAVIR